MKHIISKLVLLSILIIAISCSVLSFSSVAENYRWTFETLNPLNGVSSIAFVVSYILHTGIIASYLITTIFLLFIGWMVYVLLYLLLRLFKQF